MTRILGIGIDIIEVDRIKKAVAKNKDFLDRIYTQRELELSNRGKLRFEELAGRFAVKEAVFKALKTGWRGGVKFEEIIVLNERSGAPYVTLSGTTQQVAEAHGVKEIFVSISHTRQLAIAIALATA